MPGKRDRNNLYFTIPATLAGNAIEWYDYATFGLLIPLFSQLFFSHASGLSDVLLLFAISSSVRVTGGFLFGYIGDRWGRKTALICSVCLMTLPMFLIGLLPTYAQIGIAAPLLLTFFRILQSVAAGGEFPEIIILILESCPSPRRVFFGSLSFLGLYFGLLLGLADFWILDAAYTPEALYAGGWRWPFLFALPLGLFALFLRTQLHETPVYLRCRRLFEIKKNPFSALFQFHKRSMLQILGITVLETLAFNQIVVFLTVYLIDHLGLDFAAALRLNLVLYLSLFALTPLCGALSHRIGAPAVLLTAVALFFFLSYPLYLLLLHPSLWVKALALVGLSVPLSAYMAPLPDLFAARFPAPVRCSGISIGYNLSIGLFGAPSLLFSSALMHHFQTPLVPPFLLMAAALVSLPCLLSARQRILDL